MWVNKAGPYWPNSSIVVVKINVLNMLNSPLNVSGDLCVVIMHVI